MVRTFANCLATAALALAVAAAAGCGGETPPPPDATGEVVLDAGVLGATAAVPVARLWVRMQGTTAKGAAYDEWAIALPGLGAWGAIYPKVPVGSYRVTARAYSTWGARFTDPPDFQTVAPLAATVFAAQTTTIALVLQQNPALHPPGAVRNGAPVVEGIVASAYRLDSGAGAAVHLAARASDPDGDALSFAWSASGLSSAASGFSAPRALDTVFTPPAGHDGEITLTFSARDTLGAASTLAVVVSVKPANGNGAVAVIARVNRWPDVGAIATGQAQLPPGASTALSVTARDADGDALAYRWDDGGCGGTFDAATTASTGYRAAGTERACILTVRVTDGRGGASASTLTVNVRQGGGAFAPEFLFAAQSPESPVAPGAAVVFEADALEPDGAGGWRPLPLPMQWSDGAGGAFTPVDAGGHRMAWTAPPCGGAAGDRAVAVAVTAFGSAYPLDPSATTPFTFPVVVRCP